ncbi:MAG: hypothetical protein JEY97_15030 [Bacteroidales bacterium]|nr:hypothetical protein [Bacteroidales bacterium]
MAVIYEIKKRRVIPNWRDYRRTLQIGELGNSTTPELNINIDRIVDDWRLDQNIGTAAELVNAAFISEKLNFTELIEAIIYIRDNKTRSSNTLLNLITAIEDNNGTKKAIGTNNLLLEKDVETINEFQAFINNKSLYKIINRTKARSRNETFNPIVWVELARMYTMHGQYKKAEKSIRIALHLAPENRFVLRSATRFFIHSEQFEKALYYLRKSDSMKTDPWLISAHIATSSIMDRFSPMIKEGEKLIKSDKFSPYELTELLSSIGSLEFNDGSFKKAKSYFEKSMIQPNDNTLAQMEWVSKEDYRFQFNPFKFTEVINPFEAYALDYYEKGNWKDAFYNCIKWFLDVPFSKRPVLLGSYIAGSLLKDKNAAILLCEVGLQANPHDPTLLNNIIYDFATSGNIENASKYINQLKEVDIGSLPNESKITIQATLGLVSLRNNEFEIGKQLYELAIDNSIRIRNDYLKNLAIVNYTRELIIANQPEYEKYLKIVENMQLSDNHKDLIELRKDILDLLKKSTITNRQDYSSKPH